MSTTELWLLALFILVCIIGGLTIWLIVRHWRPQNQSQSKLQSQLQTPLRKPKPEPPQRGHANQGY